MARRERDAKTTGKEQHAIPNVPAEPERVKSDLFDDDLDVTIPDVIAVVPRLTVPLGFEWLGKRYLLWPETPADEDEG